MTSLGWKYSKRSLPLWLNFKLFPTTLGDQIYNTYQASIKSKVSIIPVHVDSKHKYSLCKAQGAFVNGGTNVIH